MDMYAAKQNKEKVSRRIVKMKKKMKPAFRPGRFAICR